MWEKTLDDLDLEFQTEKPLINLPFFREKTDSILIILIILTSALIVFFSVKVRIFHLWIEFLGSNSFLRFATYPLLISATVVITGIIFRTVLWFRYKPQTIEAGEDFEWPYVTVIMPALNEEELIEKSIDSIFSSHYPQDKLEVICVNDGSTDRTYHYMIRAKIKYGNRLQIINFKRNLGKGKLFMLG